jgi:hypothetical protein
MPTCTSSCHPSFAVPWAPKHILALERPCHIFIGPFRLCLEISVLSRPKSGAGRVMYFWHFFELFPASDYAIIAVSAAQVLG